MVSAGELLEEWHHQWTFLRWTTVSSEAVTVAARFMVIPATLWISFMSARKITIEVALTSSRKHSEQTVAGQIQKCGYLPEVWPGHLDMRQPDRENVCLSSTTSRDCQHPKVLSLPHSSHRNRVLWKAWFLDQFRQEDKLLGTIQWGLLLENSGTKHSIIIEIPFI